TLEELGRAGGHEPLVHQWLRMNSRPAAAAEANRRVHIVAREIDERRRGADLQIDLRMRLAESRETRHEPSLQEGSEYADDQCAAARRFDRAKAELELVQTTPHKGQQRLALGRQLHVPAMSPNQRHLQILHERL